ncbi:MAG TPA: hypothetical protein VN178_08250, partial [Rubrobacter sp.]|nr:hypothetical protein [Rubrobacter sp.]
MSNTTQKIECFDERLPELLDALTAADLLIISADHGNDPTFKGTEPSPLPFVDPGLRPPAPFPTSCSTPGEEVAAIPSIPKS